ncbi:unnamed protein product [Phytophthora lilii]|uniref:Unnamed protein product n=1 Tax=Phytophthora lilii TaxID=2077276 RepID=A0A9W6YDL0_9STRA|nr:unnamed protein product [Phytophthora lilii]
MKAKRNTSIAPILDLAGAVQRTEIPTSTSRQRTDENRVEDEDGSECASPSASVSPLPSRVQMNLSCRSGKLATFLNEWQQLNLPRALNDNQPLDRVAHFQDDTSASIELSPTKSSASATDQSWNVSGSAQTPKRRRRVEIEKVNAAVHDYMDRIDDKLSKMYGIPPSSAIQRSAVHHASNLPVSVDCQSQRDQRRSLNQSCEKSMRRAANCAKQSLKVSEVRMQQVHSDCEDLV